MKLLFVTSEAAPIKKFGGLGDYSASLPKALVDLGIDVDVIMPYYQDANVSGLKVYKSVEILVPFNNASNNVEVYKGTFPDSAITILLLKVEKKFSGDFINDSEFFAFFDKAVVEYIKSQYNIYDIVHCNDWHTGFITHLLEDEIPDSRPKTLTTIHNLAYQGETGAELVQEIGLIPSEHQLVAWDITDGNVNMLYQAVTSSDYVSTVSPSYREELLLEGKAAGASDIASAIYARQGRFIGILNGIDYSTLPRNYDISSWKRSKAMQKDLIKSKLRLKTTAGEDKPVFAFISRLDPNQKGVDILYEVIPEIVEMGGQFVLLGTGDKTWEAKLKALEGIDKNMRDNLSMNIEFDTDLALEIYAGCDFFFVPSRYEPCGLTQMMAMWYGALPIVHNVGGLKDTVENHQTGFTFEKYDSGDLLTAIKWAFDAYNNKSEMTKMVKNALAKDFSWKKSANEYKALYERMLKS